MHAVFFYGDFPCVRVRSCFSRYVWGRFGAAYLVSRFWVGEINIVSLTCAGSGIFVFVFNVFFMSMRSGFALPGLSSFGYTEFESGDEMFPSGTCDRQLKASIVEGYLHLRVPLLPPLHHLRLPLAQVSIL